MICPFCNKNFEPTQTDNKALPFCSARCKQIDLGRWLSESYPISVEKDPSREELEDESAG